MIFAKDKKGEDNNGGDEKSHITPIVHGVLVQKFSFVSVDNIESDLFALKEFFDLVMVSGEESGIIAIKEGNREDVESLVQILPYGKQIIKRRQDRIRCRCMVVMIFPLGIGGKEISFILKQSFFSPSFIPVIIDGLSGRLFYPLWRVPLGFLFKIQYLSQVFKSPRQKEYFNDFYSRVGETELRILSGLEDFRKVFLNSRPYTTLMLIIINILIYILIWARGGSENPEIMMELGAKVSPLIWQGEVWRLVTPIFLHVNFLHLLSNMMILYFTGSLFESMMGRWRLLWVYLAGGIAGNMLSLYGSPYFSAGASSSVFALLGGLLVYGYRYRSRIPRNFFNMLTFYILPFLVYNLLVGGLSPSMDNLAHMGGLLGGMITAGFLGADYPPFIKKSIKWAYILIAGILFSLFFNFVMIPNPRQYKYYYFIRGTMAEDLEDYACGVSYFKQALEGDKDFLPARQSLGRVFYLLGYKRFRKKRWDTALRYFRESEKYLSLSEERYSSFVLLFSRMGECYSSLGDYRKSINYIKKALIFQPDNSTIKKRLGDEYFSLSLENITAGDLEEGEKNLLTSLSYNPQNPHVLMQLGDLDYRRGEILQASSRWNRILMGTGDLEIKREAENRLRIWIFRSLWFLEEKGLESPNLPDHENQFNYRGEEKLVNQGDYHIARIYFKKAVKAGDKRAAINLARMDMYLNHLASARDQIEEVLKEDPKNLHALLLLQEIYRYGGNIPQGEKIWKKITEISSPDGEEKEISGIIYNGKGNPTIKYLRNIITLSPDNLLYRYRLARLLPSREGRKESDFIWKRLYHENREGMEIIMIQFLAEQKYQGKGTTKPNIKPVP